MPIELAVAAQCQALQVVDQVAAVAARLGQCQVLADLAVGTGERAMCGVAGLAFFQAFKLQREGVPVRLAA